MRAGNASQGRDEVWQGTWPLSSDSGLPGGLEVGDDEAHDVDVRKLLSEEIGHSANAPQAVDPQTLARWAAEVAALESRVAAARSILEDFDPDDTYGAMMRLSAIEALDGDS